MLYYGANEAMDNNNVNIVPFAKRQLYALSEGNFIIQVDPKNLDVKGKLNVCDKIPSSKTIIAHPHVLPDGSWIEMGLNATLPGYEFVKYEANQENLLENGKIINAIKSHARTEYSYFHSFGLSQNYIILLEQSLKINLFTLFKAVVLNRAKSEALYTDPKFNTRIHLINRNTGQIVAQQFHTDPVLFFHHINAYERLAVIFTISYLIISLIF